MKRNGYKLVWNLSILVMLTAVSMTLVATEIRPETGSEAVTTNPIEYPPLRSVCHRVGETCKNLGVKFVNERIRVSRFDGSSTHERIGAERTHEIRLQCWLGFACHVGCHPFVNDVYELLSGSRNALTRGQHHVGENPALFAFG